MREILFRGKRTDNGEWVFGDLEHNGKNVPKWVNGNEIAPESVGQFTGLTDNNGKKIFEGDIVIADFDFAKAPMEVIYYKCGFKLKSKKSVTAYDYSINHEYPAELEVIGSVYDNPELLDKDTIWNG